MRQRLIGLLFIFPCGLVLLGLLGGPYFTHATGGYLIGGIALVALSVVGVGAGVYYLVTGPAARINE
jgi:hypothetical protein